MPRWRQVWNEEEGRSEFIEIETTRNVCRHYIQGDIPTFVSPVDKSVISDRKQLREHNERNNVVNVAEMEGAYSKDKNPTTEQVLSRKRAIYERVIRAERGLPID